MLGDTCRGRLSARLAKLTATGREYLRGYQYIAVGWGIKRPPRSRDRPKLSAYCRWRRRDGEQMCESERFTMFAPHRRCLSNSTHALDLPALRSSYTIIPGILASTLRQPASEVNGKLSQQHYAIDSKTIFLLVARSMSPQIG